MFADAVAQAGATAARKEGDAAAALAGAAKKLEAVYRNAVPGARADGAAELHRPRARRWLRMSGRPPRCRPRRAQIAAQMSGLQPEK